MGDYLVEHPSISLIAFTGSMDVGLRIVEKAAKVQPNQKQVKRVIAEMGGKDSIIVDNEADLDDAVKGVAAAAFGFQGQKCSACSRAIVDAKLYDEFVAKLKVEVESFKQGDPQDNFYTGPVVSANAEKTVLSYIEIGKQEGNRYRG